MPAWLATRFDWGPLEEQVRRVMVREGVALNTVQIAARLGITTNTVYHYRKDNGLSPLVADRLSCAIGLHPSLVWGNDWWDAALSDMAVRAERKKARNKAHG